MTSLLGDDYTWVPVWLKLQRTGNTFSASQSLDGTNWFTVGSSTETMASTYYVGLAVSSRITTGLNTTTFDNVTTNGVAGVAGPPITPTGLWATAANSQVTLSWTASGGATSNNVKRATVSGGPYATIAAVGTTPGYTNTSLANGTRYYYVVSALNGSGESANSSEVSAIPNNPLSGTTIGTPGSYNSAGNTIAHVFDGNPGTFFDGPDASGDWAGLDFGASVSNVINQIAYCPRINFASRMVSGMFQGANVSNFSSGVVTLFTVGAAPAQSVFTFQPVTNFEAFRYVRYLGAANDNCNVAEVKFYGNSYAASLPGVPANPTATAGDAQVWLSWNASSNAADYNVKRSTTNGGPYVIAANVTATNFVNTGLSNGTIYYYVVSATNAVGESANSIPAAARPVSSAPPQINWGMSGGQIQFTWPADHTGWELQAQTNPPPKGLGSNWIAVPGSMANNEMIFALNPTNGSVFFRLVYP
jgi:hypothetical protein